MLGIGIPRRDGWTQKGHVVTGADARTLSAHMIEEDAGEPGVAKLRAGATLIQLYSALVFHGVGLVHEIKRALLAQAEKGPLADLVGIDAADITAQPWPV